jgi:hypothetical protein
LQKRIGKLLNIARTRYQPVASIIDKVSGSHAIADNDRQAGA